MPYIGSKSVHMTTVAEELSAFPVATAIPVQWGEMDAAGHVNNVVYLRWFEHARVAYLDELNYPVVLEQEGLPGVILAKQDCKYLFPVRYPDTVTMGIKVTGIEKDRFVMHCKMFSQEHQRLVAIANAVIVTYDYKKQRKAVIPARLRLGIQQLEITV